MSQIIAIIQSAPETIQYWLQTNAPAAWISALVAILTCGFLLHSRKKPKRIILCEVRNTSVVNIWPSVRHKIKMTFDDKPIDTLGQIDADIFNTGSEPVQQPTFVVTLPTKSVVLDVQLGPESSQGQTTIDGNKVAITFPYLNPIREHKQVVTLSLLIDGGTKIIDVAGGGEGWSVWHSPISNPKRDLYIQIGTQVLFLCAFPISYFWSRRIEAKSGISMNEVSWRALIAYWPAAALLLLVLLLLIFATGKNAKRLLRTVSWRNLG